MALSMLPFQSMGIMMSIVNAGSIVCMCSLISINRCSVACTMEILTKDGIAMQEAEHTLCASIM
jgi:hypothetical protein